MLYHPLTGAEITGAVAEIVVNIISFVLNGSFLLALYNKKRLGIPYNRGDIFVMNIALVDLLVTSRFTWGFLFITGANDAVCFLDAFWSLAFLGAEMCLVLGLSVERYLGVVKAMKADKRVIRAIVAVCWITGLVSGLLSVLLGTYGLTPSNAGCSIFWWESRGVAVWISGQLFLIWVSLISLYYRVWKVSSDAMNAANTSRESERALALRLFMIVFLFLVCWTPAMIAFLYCAGTGQQMPALLGDIAGVFLAFNTIVDPALFLWISPDNRKAFISFFTCATPLPKKPRKITSRGPSLRTTRTSQTREQSPASRTSSPPLSPTGPAPASELAPLPHLPMLNLALSSSDPTLEEVSPTAAEATVYAAEAKTNEADEAQSQGSSAESEGDSREPGTPSASSEENGESVQGVAQMEFARNEQGNKRFEIVVSPAD